MLLGRQRDRRKMEQELASVAKTIEAFWDSFGLHSLSPFLPSRIIQYAIIAACLLLAWSLRSWLGAGMREWMRSLEGRPKWQLRLLVIVERHLGLALFVLSIWLSVAIMAEATPFSSRRFILELVGTISTAWLAISLASRLIRNKLLRRIISWSVTVYATLYFLGVIEQATAMLDSIAIELGSFRLSLLTTLNAIVALAFLIAGARLLTRLAERQITSNTDISPSMQVLSVKFLQVVLYGTAIVVGLRFVGFDLTAFTIFSGAVGVGLGFGLQKVVSNLVSGVIILLDKSVKPGDVITLGDTFGWINSLGARYVSVVTRDGREYLIPNEDLITGQVVNWSHSDQLVRLDIYFGVSYADDPHLVRRIAVEAAGRVGRVLSSPQSVCHIVGFGDSSIDYILRFWISDPTSGLTNIRGNVYLALWDAFQEHGISIPYPQREVRILDEPAVIAQKSNET